MNEPLRFERFRVWQVVVPAREDILSAPPSGHAIYTDNLTWDQLPIHLVEATTSAGVSALGEAGRGESAENVERTLRCLLGVDLRTLSPATAWASATLPGGLPALHSIWSWQNPGGKSYSLMESLWLDAVGKAAGVPAYNLLGGAAQNRVAVDFWANRPSADTLAKLVAEASQRGLRGIKIKSDGAGDTVFALRDAAKHIPNDFRFTMDPMCAWKNFRQSRRHWELLETLPFPIQIEDPFPFHAVDEWRRVREQFPVPLIWHARDEATLSLGLQAQVADGYNLGGGAAFEFARSAEVVARAQKDCWQGSALELGVLQHLRLHAASVARNCVMPSDLQSEWVREHTLVTPRMKYEGGFAVVPDAPGLGVALDSAAVKHYSRKEWEVR
jgi:L-alanine-DL-glutamate epimerase-like enolase superfamily enzyme